MVVGANGKDITHEITRDHKLTQDNYMPNLPKPIVDGAED